MMQLLRATWGAPPFKQRRQISILPSSIWNTRPSGRHHAGAARAVRLHRRCKLGRAGAPRAAGPRTDGQLAGEGGIEGRRAGSGGRRHSSEAGRPGESRRDARRSAVRRRNQAMISKFFIDRPVFASVLSIIIVLAGLVSMRVLPIAQYPQIVPPDVVISATYPGATAETIAATVAAPLEQQINGVERMIYMQSTSTGSGTMNLSVTFEIGTNPDQNAINVNNRVQRALPLLPGEVSRQGLVVQKRLTSILQVLTMSSPDGRYDTIYISNYALVNVLDELRRLPGVGDASLFGASDYSMRIWLRPDKLAQYNLTPSDIAAVVREQNQQFAAGRFGEEPTSKPQVFTYSVTTPPRLVDRTQFEDIIIRSEENGGALRL